MDAEISDGISNAIKEIVEDIAPDVRFVSKYGGEVLATDPDSDKKFVGGIFSYEDHVSLDFSEGFRSMILMVRLRGRERTAGI